MSPTPHALTGAAAAALYQLDGFRDLEWPLRWCTPRSGTSANDAIRTRHFATSPIFGDPPVVAPRLMLRHLGEHLGDLAVPEDRVTPKERIELAVEHAIRIDLVGPTELCVPYSSRPGDCVLREIGLWRAGQPPTAKRITSPRTSDGNITTPFQAASLALRDDRVALTP